MNHLPEYQEVHPIPALPMPLPPSESIFHKDIYLLGTNDRQSGQHIYAAYDKLHTADDAPNAPQGYGECFIDSIVKTEVAKNVADKWLRDNLATMIGASKTPPMQFTTPSNDF